jgi:hypothetical protein
MPQFPRRSRRRSRLAAGCLVLVGLAAVSAPAAAEDVRVLVIHTYGHDAIGRPPFDAHPVTVIFDAAEDVDGLSPDAALCLFRVTQEALTNAVRHARARTVRVPRAAAASEAAPEA